MSTQPSSPSSLRRPASSWFMRPLLRTHGALRKPAAARVVLRLMSQLQYGVLDVHLPDGTTRRFGQASDAPGNPPYARVVLTNWNVCAAALKSGDIGFADTYLAGDWHTDDLSALLDIMVRNRTTIETVVYGSWFGKLTNRFRHLRNSNTKEGSRRNIHAHYDLGNAFYKLWLDSTMTYSSALFDGSPDQTLEDAQRAKYRRLLNELKLEGGNPSVLEIGCGWGGFAQLAASEAKANVTGLTLSTEQLAYAQQRLPDAAARKQVVRWTASGRSRSLSPRLLRVAQSRPSRSRFPARSDRHLRASVRSTAAGILHVARLRASGPASHRRGRSNRS